MHTRDFPGGFGSPAQRSANTTRKCLGFFLSFYRFHGPFSKSRGVRCMFSRLSVFENEKERLNLLTLTLILSRQGRGNEGQRIIT